MRHEKILVALVTLSLLTSMFLLLDRQVLAIEVLEPSTTTLYVGGSGPGNYSRIQDAIDNASSGDTVYVYNGTYFENIVIDEIIDLTGEDKSNTIIHGNENKTYVVFVTEDYVKINGFTIQNYGLSNFGIYLLSTDNTISDNIITNNSFGIQIQSGLYGNNTISNNVINNNEEGLVIRGLTNNNIIFSNTFLNNDRGIYIDESFNNTINDNTFINKWNGIHLYNSSKNTISENTFTNHSHHSIVLSESSHNVISTNTFKKDGGLYLLGLSSNNSVLENHFINSTFSAIEIAGSNNNLVSKNIIENTSANGIRLAMESNYNVIIENIVSNSNLSGFQIYTSCNNTISDNVITNNSVYGIVVRFSSDNNYFYHNNFINNTQNAFDECDNIWDDDYPSGGNFWDDYTGVDNDGDGIGDTSYPILGGDNEDRYPLMKPYAPSSNLEVEIKRGFSRSIRVEIENTGSVNINDITWNLTVTRRGILKKTLLDINGTITSLENGSTETVVGNPFGVGLITVTVDVEAPGIDPIQKTAKGFIFFRFVRLRRLL